MLDVCLKQRACRAHDAAADLRGLNRSGPRKRLDRKPVWLPRAETRSIRRRRTLCAALEAAAGAPGAPRTKAPGVPQCSGVVPSPPAWSVSLASGEQALRMVKDLWRPSLEASARAYNPWRTSAAVHA
jgi:hypothetical protein